MENKEKKCFDGCMNITTSDIGIKTCEFDGRILTALSKACDKFDDWSEEEKKDE
jgi:hypothetical protein